MKKNTKADTRQRFHVVQLALFNAQVLSSVQAGADKGNNTLSELLKSNAATTIASDVLPSTINQSLFFGMAYLTFVWLKESLSQDEYENALASDRMSEVWQNARIKGPRDLSNDQQKMRLVRNALSHGNVSISGDFDFEFWDQNRRGKNPERDPTFLVITSQDLGNLCQQFYFATSDALYS